MSDAYERALAARDPRGVEMIDELVRLAMEAFNRSEPQRFSEYTRRRAVEAHFRERFAQFAQSQCFALDEAFEAGRAAATAHAAISSEPSERDRNLRHDTIPPAASEARFVSPEWEGESPLSELLAGNAHDAYVCDWLRAARVGDVLDEGHGARVERVS